MESVWIQMLLGAVGSMVLGVATNLVTPMVRRGVGRTIRRVRRVIRPASRYRLVRAARRMVARPLRWLAAADRA